MVTLEELLPLIDALSPADKAAIVRHLTAAAPTVEAPAPKRRVVHHPSGRGGPPIATVVMGPKRKR